MIYALYKGFEKKWDQHHAHEAVYAPEGTKLRGGRIGLVGNGIEHPDRPTTLWKIAAQLPGVDRRAKDVANFFGTVEAMALGTEKEWKRLLGPKRGAVVARVLKEVGA